MIDEIDSKIIDILQTNARLSNAELAQVVGLTASSVYERVKKLEKRGIITGYVAMVDPEKLGKPLLAFMRLNFAHVQGETMDEARDRITKACEAESGVLECHNVAGEDCFILKLRAESPKQLEKLLSTIRSSTRGGRSVTNIVLSTYKESSKIEPAGFDGESSARASFTGEHSRGANASRIEESDHD